MSDLKPCRLVGEHYGFRAAKKGTATLLKFKYHDYNVSLPNPRKYNFISKTRTTYGDKEPPKQHSTHTVNFLLRHCLCAKLRDLAYTNRT